MKNKDLACQKVDSSMGHRAETEFTMDEVRQHCTKDDMWVVLEGKVYDVTQWKTKHPGGHIILEDNAGQDATDPFLLMHPDLALVRKYMKTYQKGVLSEPSYRTERRQAIEKDYTDLYETAKKLNLFESSKLYHSLFLLHVVALEILAYLSAIYFGVSTWPTYLLTTFLLAASWTQASWCMHDYGHRSVFKIKWLDQAVEIFLQNFVNGYSADFWNQVHNRHHSKTNIYKKDPNLELHDDFIVIGQGMAKDRAKENIKGNRMVLPFNYQQIYWFIIGTPGYVQIKFQLASIFIPLKKKLFLELLIILVFWVKNIYLYVPLMGVGYFILLMFLTRQISTHWVIMITFLNHMPLEQDFEEVENSTWVEMQCKGTMNFPNTYFLDWFTGGLNLHIEHHLFPSMPREHYRTIMPYVKKMCEKHDIPYVVKSSMFEAFSDMVTMLRKSGKTWFEMYSIAFPTS